MMDLAGWRMEVVERDRADVGALTGHAPADWDECDAELERFVLTDEGRHDDELVLLFNRRWRRYKALMGPPGSAMVAHHTIQPLGRSLLPSTVAGGGATAAAEGERHG